MRAEPHRTQTLLRRITAAVVALALALSTVAAALTIERLHYHDCTGEECVVCHVLGQAHALLQECMTGSSSPAHLGIQVALAAALVLVWRFARAAETPVTKRDLLLI